MITPETILPPHQWHPLVPPPAWPPRSKWGPFREASGRAAPAVTTSKLCCWKRGVAQIPAPACQQQRCSRTQTLDSRGQGRSHRQTRPRARQTVPRARTGGRRRSGPRPKAWCLGVCPSPAPGTAAVERRLLPPAAGTACGTGSRAAPWPSSRRAKGKPRSSQTARLFGPRVLWGDVRWMDWRRVAWMRAACSVPGHPLPRWGPRLLVRQWGCPAQRAGALQNSKAVSPGIRVRGKKLPGDGGRCAARGSRKPDRSPALPCPLIPLSICAVGPGTASLAAEGKGYWGLTWHLPCGLNASRSLTSESASWGSFFFFFFLVAKCWLCVEGCACVCAFRTLLH